MRDFYIKVVQQYVICFIFFSIISFAQSKGFNNNSLYLNHLDSENNKIEELESFNGKIIRHIYINIRDVSDKPVNEDSDWKPSWIGTVGNSLHIKSKNWVVKNKLLFGEGDSLNSQLLYESERLLRSNPQILDAKINAVPIKNLKDSVDINVIVQDKWTLSLNVSYNTNYKSGYLGLNDENFLGLGHLIKTRYTHDEDKTIGSGGKFQYTATNIAGSFIDADGRIETDNSSNFESISFSRPFLSIYIPWSGSLTFSWLNDLFKYSNDSAGTINYPFKEVTQDIWVGKTFRLGLLSKELKNNSEMFTSARVEHIDHPEKPDNEGISSTIFDSYTRYLFSTGFLDRYYYKDKLVNDFGITEDIPVGGIFSITFGKDIRTSGDRWYSGLEAIISKRIIGFGYASADFKLGGFRNSGKWEQNIFNSNFIYHSELFNYNNWKCRLFLQTDFLYGFNRLKGEQIYLNTESGIRGLDGFLLYGTKRITLNLEARVFSPFTLLGFILGGIVFSDYGIISNSDANLSRSKLYQSYGMGFRTRNQSITNTDFVISVAYIPNGISTAVTFKILFSTSVIFGSRDFGLSSPAIFKFGNN
jgi:hypothetical protein